MEEGEEEELVGGWALGEWGEGVGEGVWLRSDQKWGKKPGNGFYAAEEKL